MRCDLYSSVVKPKQFITTLHSIQLKMNHLSTVIVLLSQLNAVYLTREWYPASYLTDALCIVQIRKNAYDSHYLSITISDQWSLMN